jgi:hypothetical protein
MVKLLPATGLYVVGWILTFKSPERFFAYLCRSFKIYT